MSYPTHSILAEEAIELLRDGQSLTNMYVEGEIRIEISDIWDKEVIIENCVIEYFSGNVTHFAKPVKLINSRFMKCQFIFSYFIGGLIIDGCTFDNYLDFQAGGHNKMENPIIIKDSNFSAFVNFFDCCYNGQLPLQKIHLSKEQILKATGNKLFLT